MHKTVSKVLKRRIFFILHFGRHANGGVSLPLATLLHPLQLSNHFLLPVITITLLAAYPEAFPIEDSLLFFSHFIAFRHKRRAGSAFLAAINEVTH